MASGRRADAAAGSVTISASGSSVKKRCRIWIRIFTSSSLTSQSAPEQERAAERDHLHHRAIDRTVRVTPREPDQLVDGVFELGVRERRPVHGEAVARAPSPSARTARAP